MQQRGHFTQRLEELRVHVLRMAVMAEKAARDSIDAFFSVDSDKAEEVIQGDARINELECDLDRTCLELLALDQPMAGDLRFIVGAMRATVNLERLGDEAVNIAQRTVFLSTRPPLPFNQRMEHLARQALEMVSLSIRAFTDGDTKLADTICRMDNTADDLYVHILKEYIENMVTETRIVERGVHAIMAARHMERMGDLATNLAEAVIFIVEGENVKHACRG